MRIAEYESPGRHDGVTQHIASFDMWDLIDSYLQAGWVHREDWAALPAEARERLKSSRDPRRLMTSLVSAKLLTQYQADRIEAGTTRGLMLGNYRVLGRLGAGGMGIVFLAEHTHLRRLVAIKVLPISPEGESETLVTRFFHEIRIIAHLQHPNIVWAIDTGELPATDLDEQTLYYHVMEYVPGMDVEELVRTDGPLSPARTADIAYQVASALSEADKHQLVHRDIKPSNIIVTPEGQAKLLDFGLARTPTHRHTQPGAILGSVDYMAPEQVRDASAVDCRADLYSLGGTMFWCLAGRPPFPSDAPMTQVVLRRATAAPPSIRAVRPDVSAAMDEVIARMMATKPEDRYANPAAAMRALLPFLSNSSGELCYLPTHRVSAPAAATEGAATQRVLLVDDEAGIRSLLRIVLESDGLECVEACDGAEALEAAQKGRFDLVLLDVEMPGMPGPEVLRRLRDTPPTANLKVIMLSGRATGDDMSGMMLAGADDFLTKPFSVVQLNARVKGALRLKSAQDRSDGLLSQLIAQNARAEETLQAKDGDLADARSAMVLALAELIAYRGAESSAHLQRVQSYVRSFGRELAARPAFKGQLDDAFVQMLEGVTPLHDIGMIGLPEHILLKPGQLSQDERIIMQSHTTIASDIFEKVSRKHSFSAAFLRMALDVARHHHERWDGKGYPDGLSGGDIPLAARIVAIADVYDALRSRRPHKPPLSHAGAVHLMLEASAGHFDPALLQVFRARHENFAEVYRELPD